MNKLNTTLFKYLKNIPMYKNTHSSMDGNRGTTG